MKKILISMNDPIKSIKALNFALNLFKDGSVEFILLDVIPDIELPPMHSYIHPIRSPKTMINLSRAGKQIHVQFLTDMLLKFQQENPHIRMKGKFIEGNPKKKLIELINRRNYDLVITGNKKMGKEVLKKIKQPILIVN